ncbi:molybdenum cofactor guanylyltransferase [Salinibacterium sp. M195]|uniref:molybdenum cofactor guanylyltransferase n=1 Tax=Salinibacterium sp. M195 TaxID=2583374 RepID=UPI001C6308A3|nr:NTP transferase domain-containing protein [Salinibacterium sp. M195]QYH36724.1 molybdopterin-guanine dinucleotide biosynthesis protein [Salinibacterium sp. M195]
MLIDAVVLAGGRSSRLGFVPKASLLVDNESLLEKAVIAALGVSRSCVVVGPLAPEIAGHEILAVQEDPPFSGPAAALAAGLRLLPSGSQTSESVLVLACDMPGIAVQLPALVAALNSASRVIDGAISLDPHGYRQPLAALYRHHELTQVVSQFSDLELIGLSMRAVIEQLNLLSVPAALGVTDDVDSWEDAARLGATEPQSETQEGTQ